VGGVVRVFVSAVWVLLVWALVTPEVRAAEPYVSFETGIASRDVVDEGNDLVGGSFTGNAVSTRILTRVGVDLNRYADLYFLGGGADLSIDEFDNFDSNFHGVYGAGLRVNLFRSGYRDDLTLFAEGNWLYFTANDQVRTYECPPGTDCDADPDAYLPRNANEKITWNEYTARVGASGRMEVGTIFGGFRLSFVDGQDRIRARPDSNFSQPLKSNLDLKQDDTFGLFFGVNLFLDRLEKTVVTLEASLIDQDSFRAAIRRYF
jgi:hypothetical protein